MNENEMNVQNVGNNQPINPNVGIPQQNNVNMSVMPEQLAQNTGAVQQPQMQPIQNPEVISNQENINMGIPQNPISQTPVGTVPMNDGSVDTIVPPANNIMEDFSQAVVSEPVTPVINTPPTTPTNSTVNNIPVESQPTISTPPSQENVQPAISNNDTTTATSTQVEEINPTEAAEGKTGKKKKGNWAFIIALFAVVGFFVLLLPLLVRIFGY